MYGENLLCVVCSAHVTNSEPHISTNYSNFSQFCGELEKCGIQNDKPFNAKQFFHNVDTASRCLLICSECKEYINEAMEIRANLEKWEMEVLKLQIELLMKLNELERCNNIYFSKMNRIYDKVKNSVDKEIQEEGWNFGATNLSKDDVFVFRERILDVVTNLAFFRDNLSRKINLMKSPEAPFSEPYQPEADDLVPADDFEPMQIDNLKHERPCSEQDSISDNDETNQGQDDDYIANEEVSSEDDNFVNEPTLIPEKSSKKKSKKNPKSRKMGKLFTNLPQLPFQLPEDTSSHKKLLLQSIIIPPTSILHPSFTHDTAYTFMLQKYPWNYAPTSDTLTLATLPITVTEENSQGNDETLTLQCSTCNFSTIYNHTDHFQHHSRAIFTSVRKMFEHVVSGHLNGFKCPLGPKCFRKMRTFKVLCKHLKRLHDTDKKQVESLAHDPEDEEPTQISKATDDDSNYSNANEEKAQTPDEDDEKTENKLNPQKAYLIFDKLAPLPFIPPEGMSSHKKLLIQCILIPPTTSPLQPPFLHNSTYIFMLQRYPWNYSSTSDTLTLATHPITVTEDDHSLSLTCPTCYYSTIYKYSNAFRNRTINTFSIVRQMFEHVVSSHLNGFTCPIGKTCRRKMGTLKVLCKHLKRAHGSSGDRTVHCSVCGKGCVNLQDCLDHEETHKEKGERDYVTCDTCGTKLLRRSLRQHKLHSCGKRAPRTVCQVCGASFSKKQSLGSHMMRKHPAEEEKKWGCDICGKRFGVEVDLKNHKINKHRIYPEGMDKECRKGCGKKFALQLTRSGHEDKCDGVWVNL